MRKCLLSLLFCIFVLASSMPAFAAYTFEDQLDGTYTMTDDGAYIVDVNDRTNVKIDLYMAVDKSNINIPAFQGQYFFEYVREDGSRTQLLYKFQPANRKLIQEDLTEDCDIWFFRFYVEPGSFIFSDRYGSIGPGSLPDSYTLTKDYTLQTEDFRDAEDILSWPELVTIPEHGNYSVYALYGDIEWRDRNLNAFSDWVAKKDAADKAAAEGIYGETITVETPTEDVEVTIETTTEVTENLEEQTPDETIQVEEGLLSAEETTEEESAVEIPTVEETKEDIQEGSVKKWAIGGIGLIILCVLVFRKADNAKRRR